MKIFIISTILIFFPLFNNLNTKDISINEAVNNPYRKKENIKRDKFRNPIETLTFFELKRNKKVLEIIPGRGWYTEILSTFMKNSDNFYVATYERPTYAIEIIEKIQKDFFKYFKNEEENFGEIKTVFIDKNFELKNHENYFDLILTFRNTHNFLDQNKFHNILKSIHKSLRKDGILGVVQHRADESSNFDFKKGYVKESFLIKNIEKYGFKLISKSEINANPDDLKNYKNGVWSLPPRLSEGENKKSFYKSIGESDRMTLKFKKIK